METQVEVKNHIKSIIKKNTQRLTRSLPLTICDLVRLFLV